MGGILSSSGRTVVAGALACLIAPACGDPAAPSTDGGPNATVLAVVDGDTIRVDIDGREERVRLLGIDTPEVAHPAGDGRAATEAECFGTDATTFTSSLLPPGSDVRLERDIVGRDHYDRILAHVFAGGIHVNAAIVAAGYGTPLFIEPNSVHRDAIIEAAALAEAADRGLWAAC